MDKQWEDAVTMQDAFRRRAGWLAHAAAWTAALLALAIAFDAAWVAILKRTAGFGGGDFRGTLHAVGGELAMSVAALCLAVALWRLKAVFARVSEGATFAAQNAVDLAGCGRAVIAAAAAQLLVTPTLLAWLDLHAGPRLDFSWQALALGLFGAALALLGDAMREASAARAELDQIV